MESCKVAFFCWESLYAERVGGLANAATNLAETLVKQNHEVHYFTRGSIPDQTINGVQYHYCRPFGQNIVEYCNDMSKAMVSQFRTHDSPGRFDFLHFHDWHPVQASITCRTGTPSSPTTQRSTGETATSSATGGSSGRFQARSGTAGSSRSG